VILKVLSWNGLGNDPKIEPFMRHNKSSAAQFYRQAALRASKKSMAGHILSINTFAFGLVG
jgi:hypothetical protein